MHAAWPLWTLLVCVAAGLACALAGLVPAGVAAVRAAKHAGRIAALPIFSQGARAQAYGARITADLDSIEQLLARAKRAVDELDAGIRELRLPQAAAALQAAGAALRLLLSGR